MSYPVLSKSAKQNENDTKLCAVCGAKATVRCMGCKARYYCGPEHQSDDGSKHKEHCVKNQATEGFGNNGLKPRSYEQAIKEDKGKWGTYRGYY